MLSPIPEALYEQPASTKGQCGTPRVPDRTLQEFIVEATLVMVVGTSPFGNLGEEKEK
jgi:hypothetical protein